MLCWAQEPSLLNLAPVDLPDVGPRLITTGSQELLQNEKRVPYQLAAYGCRPNLVY